MKKGNQKSKQFLLAFLLTIGFQLNLSASEKVIGNGIIKTVKKTLPEFHKIEVGTFCNVKVTAGGMSMMELKLDENLLKYLETKVEDGILKINTDKWLEATVIQLNVSTPFITSFINSGWGKITIQDLETAHFKLTGKTGTFFINGKVDELVIEAGTGNINASKMIAKRVKIDKSSHGTVRVNALESLEINGNTAKVYYTGGAKVFENGISKPENSSIKISTVKIEYIDVKIKNNSLSNMAFIIRGPKERKFSYGFSLFPYSIKSEKVPVGTMFFDKTIRGEKLLRTIKANDHGKTINLFE